jgi:protein-tyrosine phosphatase
MYNQNYNEIVQHLYLGNVQSLSDSDKFNFIVNCTPDAPKVPEKTLTLSVKDDPYQSTKLFEMIQTTSVLEIIHDKLSNHKKVLVHCHMGIQRSAAIVACYLIRYYGATVEQAVSYIKNKRPVAFFGSVNFMQTLKLVHGS